MSAAPSLVLDGLTLDGRVNVDDAVLLDHVQQSLRRGHPQIWKQAIRPERVCIVGGGPSLDATFDELRALVFAGAQLVTVNGAYQWCLDRNLKPHAQIVMDARASNARFVSPDVPNCRYYLASQCAPALWDAVEGRPFVGIFHDVATEAIKAELESYYAGRYQGVGGGTTVGTRAIGLLRMLGYVRMDLFGMDSCWMGDAHHAYAQAENADDRRLSLRIHPTGAPDLGRTFHVAPWHVKQLEDLILLIRHAGDQFLLNIHGDGLLAYALRASADVQFSLDDRADLSTTGA